VPLQKCAPLNNLTSSNVKFEWHSSHQQAFDEIKKVIGPDIQVLLCYPEFNKTFHLYTNASDHQLGAVIMQDRKPINNSLLFAKAKCSSAQKRYTTTERNRDKQRIVII
jgi:hypothetical protein